MINIGSDVSAFYIEELQLYGNTYYVTKPFSTISNSIRRKKEEK